jgi:TPR repeat protein
MPRSKLWQVLRAPYRGGLGLPIAVIAVVALFLVAGALALPPWATPMVDAFGEAKTAFKQGDYETAADLFTKLANKGNAGAQYWLAHMTELGLGVTQDTARALLLYKRAAARNVTQANLRLGEIYLRGNLVPPDFAKAPTYLKRAAYNSDAEAAELLSEMHRRGLSVAADPKEAYAWSEVAVIQGDETARRTREAAARALRARMRSQW